MARQCKYNSYGFTWISDKEIVGATNADCKVHPGYAYYKTGGVEYYYHTIYTYIEEGVQDGDPLQIDPEGPIYTTVYIFKDGEMFVCSWPDEFNFTALKYITPSRVELH